MVPKKKKNIMNFDHSIFPLENLLYSSIHSATHHPECVLPLIGGILYQKILSFWNALSIQTKVYIQRISANKASFWELLPFLLTHPSSILLVFLLLRKYPVVLIVIFAVTICILKEYKKMHPTHGAREFSLYFARYIGIFGFLFVALTDFYWSSADTPDGDPGAGPSSIPEGGDGAGGSKRPHSDSDPDPSKGEGDKPGGSKRPRTIRRSNTLLLRQFFRCGNRVNGDPEDYPYSSGSSSGEDSASSGEGGGGFFGDLNRFQETRDALAPRLRDLWTAAREVWDRQVPVSVQLEVPPGGNNEGMVRVILNTPDLHPEVTMLVNRALSFQQTALNIDMDYQERMVVRMGANLEDFPPSSTLFSELNPELWNWWSAF